MENKNFIMIGTVLLPVVQEYDVPVLIEGWVENYLGRKVLKRGLLLVLKLPAIIYIIYSLEIRGLCLMKCFSKMLHLPHFWKTKDPQRFFKFVLVYLLHFLT